MRKTKIICTMGPAVRNPETLKALLYAGMNVARLNFSHGDHEYHRGTIELLREASRQTSIPVALLLDTKGPEIRTGIIKGGNTLNLITGKKIILTADSAEGDENVLSISYKKLPEEVTRGKHILIADGLIDLEVEKVEGTEIHCVIRNGGLIGSYKNVNVIGVKTSLPAVTEADVRDIMFGIEQGIDFIAASFIRKPSDIKEIKAMIDICDVRIHIIAKIEDQEGLDNIDEIIRVSDGVMVARGDLGVQLNPEEIPLTQKRIIAKCNEANKAVITATQMLDSMINNPLPTRAEVADVANAIFDGTDAIMLSGETAGGKYPVQTVEMMNKISLEVEASEEYKNRQVVNVRREGVRISMAETISRAANLIARDIKADAILSPTLRGNTPKLLSKYRPDQIIIAVTPYEDVRRKLLLYWGIYPVVSELTDNSEKMTEDAIAEGLEHGLLKKFDKIVIAAGIPVNSPIMLNTIKVHIIADILCKGLRGYGGKASGRIVKISNAKEAAEKIRGDGNEILLAKYMDESIMPLIKKIKGYILQEFSSMGWKEIEKENPQLTAVAGALNAMDILKDGQIVTIDGQEKMIYDGMPQS